MKPGLFGLSAAFLLAFGLGACESGRSARMAGETSSPERVYTVMSAHGGSDEVRVRCPGTLTSKLGGLERRRVHVVWEFRRSGDEPLRFDPSRVRLEDPFGRSFGPSEVRVNGQTHQALDLSRAAAAFVDIFFDLGAGYPLRDLDMISVHWALDLGDSVREFTSRFYQQPRARRARPAGSSLGMGVGYSGGRHGRAGHVGVGHSVWWP